MAINDYLPNSLQSLSNFNLPLESSLNTTPLFDSSVQASLGDYPFLTQTTVPVLEGLDLNLLRNQPQNYPALGIDYGNQTILPELFKYGYNAPLISLTENQPSQLGMEYGNLAITPAMPNIQEPKPVEPHLKSDWDWIVPIATILGDLIINAFAAGEGLKPVDAGRKWATGQLMGSWKEAKKEAKEQTALRETVRRQLEPYAETGLLDEALNVLKRAGELGASREEVASMLSNLRDKGITQGLEMLQNPETRKQGIEFLTKISPEFVKGIRLSKALSRAEGEEIANAQVNVLKEEIDKYKYLLGEDKLEQFSKDIGRINQLIKDGKLKAAEIYINNLDSKITKNKTPKLVETKKLLDLASSIFDDSSVTAADIITKLHGKGAPALLDEKPKLTPKEKEIKAAFEQLISSDKVRADLKSTKDPHELLNKIMYFKMQAEAWLPEYKKQLEKLQEEANERARQTQRRKFLAR